jgi:hypothetical protein
LPPENITSGRSALTLAARGSRLSGGQARRGGDPQEAGRGEVDAVAVEELAHRRDPERLPPGNLGRVGGTDADLDDGGDGRLPVGSGLHDGQGANDPLRGRVGHARCLVRAQAGELHRRPERPAANSERERYLHRSAVGMGVGGLDAEHRVGVPQSPQLLVTGGV